LNKKKTEDLQQVNNLLDEADGSASADAKSSQESGKEFYSGDQGAVDEDESAASVEQPQAEK